VNVNEVEPFRGMLVAAKALMITGGPTTVIEALETMLGPASFEVETTLLFFRPLLTPVTFNEIVHEPLAASVPADKLAEDAPATAVVVPPQVLPSAVGEATTNPAGKLSVNATPVSPKPGFEFCKVNVSVVEPFSGILDAPKTLVIVAGVATVRFADAVLPVPPLVEVTFPVVLVKFPDVVPTTLTAIAQDALADTVPPPKLMLAEPAVAVAVPPQVLLSPFGVATIRPDGSVSVKAAPVRATVLAAGLVSVKVSKDVPFTTIAAGVNTLAIEGGASTATLADAVPPVPPSVDVTAPVVLFFAPAVVPVTFKWKLQLLPAGRVPPDRLITLLPAVAVIVPVPQLPTNPLGVEMIRPAGSVSVNPTPEKLCVALLFWMLKSKSIVPFSGILATGTTPNCLVSAGAEITVRLAFEVFPVPPSIEVTCTLLFATPATVPVTFTVIVHEALVASVPPDRLTEPDPAAAVAIPLQVLFRLLGVATTRVPCVCGNVSVNPMPVRATPALGFVILKVSEVVPF
jgi:hypothetical protein